MSPTDDLTNNFDPHIEIGPNEKIDIEYKNPKFWHRCVADIIDFLIAVVIFFVLFISCRGIVGATPKYKSNMEELETAQVESGLYIDDSDWGVIDVVKYLNRVDYTGYARMDFAQGQIDQFLAYCDEKCSAADAIRIHNSYDEARLSDDFVDEYGQHYFVVDEESGEIIINGVCYENVGAQGYFDNFYTYYIDEVAQGYLVVAIPNYYELTKYQSNMLIWAEITPAFLVTGILVYYVPTWIFKRGRKTIGKLAYHIGLLDKRLLNPTWKKTLARFLIFYFAEWILSIFTFGIPLIISFSMMAFSRNKQGFPDYMLQLVEVDTLENNIYDNYDDIKIELMRKNKKPVNFRHRDLQ